MKITRRFAVASLLVIAVAVLLGPAPASAGQSSGTNVKLYPGLFPMMAMKTDFIGYLFTNSAPMMFPWGGRERNIGNNPLAYAIPAGKYQPVVLDFSLSVVPSGKLILSRKKGEKIPLGWAFDKNGLPTEDPFEGYEGGGSLAPVGGHKGYGLVLVHEMLTSVLTGGKWTQYIKSLYEEDPTGIQGPCHSFMAINPDCFVGKEKLKKEMDRYIKTINQSTEQKSQCVNTGHQPSHCSVLIRQSDSPCPCQF